MEQKKAERNSGIELLKIFAMVIIIFSHAIPVVRGGVVGEIPAHFIDVGLATKSIQRIIIVLIRYGGQLGNDIFIISSAWFLLESKKVNIRKVMYMVGDCFTVSVFFLICFLAAGYNLGIKEIIKQFMPTYMAANWFICCYLLLYMIHPMLNMIIGILNKEKMLITNIVAVFIYCGLQFLRLGSMYYSRLIGFVCIYFIVAYTKKYLKNTVDSVKANRIILMLSLLGNFMLIMITNLLGLHISFFSTQLGKWCVFINPFLILTALSMFLLVRQKQFVNCTINYISGLSMLVYIIHSNELIMNHLRGDIFKYIYDVYSYKYELFWVSAVAIILIVFGILAGIIYRYSLQKLSHKICDWIYKFAKPVCNWVISSLLRFE